MEKPEKSVTHSRKRINTVLPGIKHERRLHQDGALFLSMHKKSAPLLNDTEAALVVTGICVRQLFLERL